MHVTALIERDLITTVPFGQHLYMRLLAGAWLPKQLAQVPERDHLPKMVCPIAQMFPSGSFAQVVCPTMLTINVLPNCPNSANNGAMNRRLPKC